MDVVKVRSRSDRLWSGLKRWGWLVAGIAVCAVAIAFLSWRQRVPSVDGAELWVGIVQRGAMSIEAVGTGVLKPREVRWLTAQTAATVQRIVRRAGAQVSPETIIVELASPDAIEALRAAEAAEIIAQSELTRVRADTQAMLLDQQVELASSEAGLAKAQIQLQAERRAFELQAIPEITFRRSEVEAEQFARVVGLNRKRFEAYASTTRSRVAVAEANLKIAQSEAAFRRRQVDALRVRAGISGVVQQVLVEEGRQVVAGVSIARIARPETLIAELKIPEIQAREVAVGQQARVDTRFGVVDGRVSRVDPAVDSGNVAVDVEFDSGLPSGARPDLSVEGVIVISQRDSVLYLPRPAKAVAGEKGSVFRIDPSGSTAQRFPVRFGSASARSIEIKEGLRSGDSVILSDVSRFDKFDTLRIRR